MVKNDMDILPKEKWGEFKIGDLFSIENCRCSKIADLKSGNMPYVGATNRKNGVLSFVQPIVDFITKGNCIAFICDGEGSIGYSIYKKEDFIGSTTVKAGRNNFLNKYIAFFITSIADRTRSNYNFGFKRNTTHLKNEKILLPVTATGEPHYEYMENYMRKLEWKKIKEYEKYISKRLNELQSFKAIKPLQSKDWQEFKIGDLFSIERGKRLKKEDHKKGKIPYASSTTRDNGIDAFIGNKEKVRVFSNCLTLANSGSVGACFYQPFEFIVSDHVTKLENNFFNKYSYKFASLLISRLSQKYSFNREINTTRLKNEKILLPVTATGEPHYEYMENYMRKLEWKKIKEYENYISKRLNELQKSALVV